MTKPTKRSARERLLEHARFGSDARQHMIPTKYDAALRRLLRAHERELAERAADIAFLLSGCPKDAVRRAILGPQRTRKGGAR